jgi:hypothetical protein
VKCRNQAYCDIVSVLPTKTGLHRWNLPVDLRKISESIDQSQRHCPCLSRHVTESRCSIRQRAAICRPEASRHDDQESIPGLVSIDKAYGDGADQRANKPACDDKAALLREFVSKVACRYNTDKSNGVNRHHHELRVNCAVSESCYQCRIKVGQGRRSNDDHVTCDKDPDFPRPYSLKQCLSTADVHGILGLGHTVILLESADG